MQINQLQAHIFTIFSCTSSNGSSLWKFKLTHKLVLTFLVFMVLPLIADSKREPDFPLFLVSGPFVQETEKCGPYVAPRNAFYPIFMFSEHSFACGVTFIPLSVPSTAGGQGTVTIWPQSAAS